MNATLNEVTLSQPERNRIYLCFSLDTDEDQAARRYIEKFGGPPERIIEYLGMLWLGPTINSQGENTHESEP